MGSPERLESFFARHRNSASGRRRPEPVLEVVAKQPRQQPPSQNAKERLLRKLLLVKRARFNAAKRLEGKHDAGQLAFAIAGIYGFLIPLFTLQFKGALVPLTANLIDFVAVISGALSFAIGFLYQERDYRGRARQLHTCALRINQLRHELSIAPIRDEQDLHVFLKRYNETLAHFENHDDIDYEIAKAQLEQSAAIGTKRRVPSGNIAALKLKSFFITHATGISIWLVPPITGAVLWAVMG